MSFEQVQMEVIRWSEARKIIPNSTPLAQWSKALEELHELRVALEKDDTEEIIDAVGDTMVCLINVCALLDVDLVQCLESAYEQIKDRTGHMNEAGIFVKDY